MKPIFLIGFPGCGKSTLCRSIQRLKGIDVIDLDDYIVEAIGMSIREYFAAYGEVAFRKIEREKLIEVANRQDIIVACGGGAPCHFDNIDIMNRAGVTIWLDAPVSILFSRLARGRHKRPLIAAMNDEQLTDYITNTLKERSKFYSQAQHIFSSALLESEQERDETAKRFIDSFLT